MREASLSILSRSMTIKRTCLYPRVSTKRNKKLRSQHRLKKPRRKREKIEDESNI
jgi:hypothetical protein